MIAKLLWTFNIRRSEKTSSETALPFQYDDSEAAAAAAFHDHAVRVYYRNILLTMIITLYSQLTTSPRQFPAVFDVRLSRHSDS